MKISVIVPVYNAERYLQKCVYSVIRQTYQNWELIIVDDGSTDNSPLLIHDFAAKDSRIITICQKNKGPGIARNKGILNANGDYAVFLDADDYIDPDYFALLVQKAEMYDVVFIDINQVTENGRILNKEFMSRYKMWNKDRILRAQMTGKIPWGGVRKAVSLNFIKDNNIFYSSSKIGEESLYSFRLLEASNRISFIDSKPVYFYVNHEGSQSKLISNNPYGNVLKLLDEYVYTSGTFHKYASTLNSFNLVATIVSIDCMTQMYKGVTLIKAIDDRLKEFHQSYYHKYSIDMESLPLKAKIFIPFLKCDIVFPIMFCSIVRKVLRKMFFKRI